MIIDNSIMFDVDTIISFDFFKEQELDKLLLSKGYLFLGEGRHRRTYLSPNKRFVLKYPHCRDGILANQRESMIWKNNFNKDVNKRNYAPCRLIKETVLMMQAVVEIFGETRGCANAIGTRTVRGGSSCDQLPSWVYNIDSMQVGKLANGKLVAYDYAG
jgi:hypothetical protein